MRLSPKDPGALLASALAHCVLVACGALLWSHRATPSPEEAAIDVVMDEAAPLPGSGQAAPDGRSASQPVPVRDPLAPSVPPSGQSAAHPDLGAPGRGGSREGERASNLASSVDPLTLERNPPNHLTRSEVQRLRTARARRTWDDRRATPHPMELDFVASGRGRDATRRPLAATSPNQGTANGSVPILSGATPGASVGAGWEGPRGAANAGGEPMPAFGLPIAQRGPVNRVSAQIITARPWVPATRAAVPASERDQPSDTLDSRQRIASRVTALLDASTLGGTAAFGVGGENTPTPAPPALGNGASFGARSQPSGKGIGVGDPGDDPREGFYRSVVSQLTRALWDTFPVFATAEGRGGLVVFELKLLEDGRVAAVSVVRPSGVEEFDRNVLRAVRGVARFGRVPQALGSGVAIRFAWDARNPAVGRTGPGPGHLGE